MRALRPVVDVVGPVLFALVLLGLFFTAYNNNLAFGFPEGFRVLFNFMDVGLGIWAILLVIFSVRGTLTAGKAFFFLVIGAVVNLLVVTTVGFIQTGGWATQLILYAIEAGTACIFSAAFVVPLVHRLMHTKR